MATYHGLIKKRASLTAVIVNYLFHGKIPLFTHSTPTGWAVMETRETVDANLNG